MHLWVSGIELSACCFLLLVLWCYSHSHPYFSRLDHCCLTLVGLPLALIARLDWVLCCSYWAHPEICLCHSIYVRHAAMLLNIRIQQ